MNYISRSLLLIVCLAQASYAAAAVKGNGSTLLKGFLQRVIQAYNAAHPTPVFTYPGNNGSGAGVTGVINKQLNFAGSDVPPTQAQINAGHAKNCILIPVPVALTGIAFAYHLPRYTLPLKLTAQNIADILTGKIKFWDDPAFFALNPHLAGEVGRLRIKPVVRTNGSGSTGDINAFLRSALGAAKWPFTGIQAPTPVPPGFGNTNSVGRANSVQVAEYVNATPGGFGYVGFNVVKTGSYLNVKTASIKNKSGNFIAPTLVTIGNVLKAQNVGLNTINSPVPDAYPIASPTNVIVCQCQSQQNERFLEGFLEYVIEQGQNFAPAKFLVKLNAQLRQLAHTNINKIRNCA